MEAGATMARRFFRLSGRGSDDSLSLSDAFSSTGASASSEGGRGGELSLDNRKIARDELGA